MATSMRIAALALVSMAWAAWAARPTRD
jgi:hypothetical protein